MTGKLGDLRHQPVTLPDFCASAASDNISHDQRGSDIGHVQTLLRGSRAGFIGKV